MDLVIVEDEQLSAERLKHLVLKIDSSINVKEILPSVEIAEEWFRDNSPPDLLLLDIQLSDGTGFDLLKTLNTIPSIIFTTAYDEYALKAFKYNSIEYLLKPIEEAHLAKALQKFKDLNRMPMESDGLRKKMDTVQKSISGEFKRRFLIKIGEQFQNVEVNNISYLYYEKGGCFLVTNEGKRLPIDYSLDQLEEILNPMDFFRINRQFLIRSEAIEEIHTYLNSRLLLKLKPEADAEIIVSRDRVNNFKRWMDC